MAEDKKSFVAYSDWKGQFDLLSNEEAGILIKHILSYVNDEDPVLPESNRIIQIAFEPIKSQLKRDLKKYENKKRDKSENGIIGNLKRWHTDLYDLVTKKEITLENAQKIAYSRSKSLSDRPRSTTIAKIADTVNDNVTVNDTVTVNVNDTDTVIESIELDSAENKFSSTKKHQKTIEEKKEEFKKSIEPFREKYDSEMLNDFWRYWTEKNKNGKKMRFEMQKVFDVGRRLITWSKNENNKFNGTRKQTTVSQSRQERVDEVREFRIANQQALADRLSNYLTGDPK